MSQDPRVDCSPHSDSLAGLTPEQHEAVTAPHHPLVIVAGPGAGKTRTLVSRAGWSAAQGIAPSRLLLLTFTNKAAAEAVKRLQTVGEGFKASTFHSFAASVMLQASGCQIADMDGAESMMQEAIRGADIGVDAGQAKKVLSWVSFRRNNGASLQQPPDDAVDFMMELWGRYDELKRRYKLLDFDDLLDRSVTGGHMRMAAANYDMLLVDEVQDTNVLQYRMVRDLAEPHSNVTMVGDMDQSIYGWRGATPQNLSRFADEYKAQVVELTVNHRSTSEIVQFSRSIIDQTESPLRANELRSSLGQGIRPTIHAMIDDEQEGEAIARWAKTLMGAGVSPTEIAVLFRTNAQTRPVETALASLGLPYTVVGAHSFFDRREIKDCLAFMRAALNPSDLPSFRRAAMCIPGIGDGTIGDVCQAASQGAAGVAGAIDALPGGPRKDSLQMLAQSFADIGEMRPEEAVEHVKDDWLEYAYKDDRVEERLENLGQLYQVAAKYASVPHFVTSASLISAADVNHKGVCLITCHAAKGLEFDSVWVAGAEDGMFPHFNSDDLDEECRLLYVACTRAKHMLNVSWCRTRSRWGSRDTASLSPFLETASRK